MKELDVNALSTRASSLARRKRARDQGARAQRRLVPVRHIALLALSLAGAQACGGSDGKSAEDGAIPRDDGGIDAGNTVGEDGSVGPGTDGAVDARADTGIPADDSGLTGPLSFPALPKRHLAMGADVCVIAQDHTVQCTGNSMPKATENHDFVKIVAGGLNVCGVRSDQTMYCWYGRFDAAEMVPPGHGFVDLTGPGDSTSCGLLTDGTASCTNRLTKATFIHPGPFTQISAPDDDELCGLTPQGSVMCSNEDGTFSHPMFGDGNLQVSPASVALCIISAQKSLRCLQRTAGTDIWPAFGPTLPAVSSFAAGQTLCSADAAGIATCTKLSGLERLEPPAGVHFVDLAMGDREACGISDAGDVWCWEDLNQQGGGMTAHKVTFPKPALTD